MEPLNDDKLIVIAKKVAEFGTPHHRDLLLSSKNHARICANFMLSLGLYPQITWTDLMITMLPSIKPIFST